MRSYKPYYDKDGITIYHGDCLDIMDQFEDKSFDLILTDPQYGVTQNKDDITVDLSDLFRVGNGVVMTTQQPYTTDVISQFRKEFKYELIWDKVLATGFLNANRMPLRSHENILIFGNVVYHPQKVKGKKNHSKGKPKENRNNNYGKYKFVDNVEKNGDMKHPKSILRFKKPHPSIALHRTQKPIKLMEWLINSYSNKSDFILDPFMGSGTTLLAAKILGRRAVGIEKNLENCDIAVKRIKEHYNLLFNF